MQVIKKEISKKGHVYKVLVKILLNEICILG
jgi:hypothetical protein